MNNKLKSTFKKYLGILESNSTCRRVKVAAVIVKDGRTVSTGWNGVPSGFKHCEEIFVIKDKPMRFGEPYAEPKLFYIENAECYLVVTCSWHPLPIHSLDITTFHKQGPVKNTYLLNQVVRA